VPVAVARGCDPHEPPEIHDREHGGNATDGEPQQAVLLTDQPISGPPIGVLPINVIM
jgi:hypothetical protein